MFKIVIKSLLFFAASSALQAFVIVLPGESESAQWSGLTSANYSTTAGFPGYFTTTNPWPAALTPDVGSSASALFNKVSGGGYFASSSLYDAGTPGTFEISDVSPIDGLKTVVFRADVGSPFAGIPLLNYNGGSQALNPDLQANMPGNFFSGFGGPPSPTTEYAWQWNLSGVDNVQSYEILWSTAAHGTIYTLSLDAGTTFAAVIPEPGTTALGAMAVTILLLRRRRNHNE